MRPGQTLLYRPGRAAERTFAEMRYLFVLCLLLCGSFLPGHAQSLLRNGSFERGVRGQYRMPSHWVNAGPAEQSPPDVHTNARGHFGVTQQAAAGEVFMGLVSRADYTFEMLGQRPTEKLRAGVTYRLTLSVCRSPQFASVTRRSNYQLEDFTTPIPFDVYVAKRANGGAIELISRSAPVDHTDWRTYTVEFTPTRDWKYLRIGAGLNGVHAKAVNGHILIDEVRLDLIVPNAPR